LADYAAVAEVPETRFADTPGGRIAYRVVGDGPLDLLVCHAPLFPIDHMRDEPSLVRFLDRLSSFSRHGLRRNQQQTTAPARLHTTFLITAFEIDSRGSSAD
jgi:hypothetical protein